MACQSSSSGSRRRRRPPDLGKAIRSQGDAIGASSWDRVHVRWRRAERARKRDVTTSAKPHLLKAVLWCRATHLPCLDEKFWAGKRSGIAHSFHVVGQAQAAQGRRTKSAEPLLTAACPQADLRDARTPRYLCRCSMRSRVRHRRTVSARTSSMFCKPLEIPTPIASVARSELPSSLRAPRTPWTCCGRRRMPPSDCAAGQRQVEEALGLLGQRARRLRLAAAQSAHGPPAKHIEAHRIEEQSILAVRPEAELQIAPGCLLANRIRSDVVCTADTGSLYSREPARRKHRN